MTLPAIMETVILEIKINWQNPFGEKGQTIVNVGIGYPF